jgi:hypothetical protein
VTPKRYIRSQQQRQQVEAEEAVEGDEPDGEEEEAAPAVDPYDLLDPVDILSKLPKDFYEKLEAKKWQERKESMDELEKLLQNPKLEGGDYGELVRALKKVRSLINSRSFASKCCYHSTDNSKRLKCYDCGSGWKKFGHACQRTEKEIPTLFLCLCLLCFGKVQGKEAKRCYCYERCN